MILYGRSRRMVDLSRYIVDGNVKRDKIVADVKRGRLSVADIKELDQNADISGSYFGEAISLKDKSLWDDKYLDELALASVGEVYNKDYLLKLKEVADYIISKNTEKERKAKIIKLGITGVVIVTVIVALVALLTK